MAIRGGTPPRGADAPSIFVRTLGVSNNAMAPLPIALYPLREIASKDELDYVGFFFRVEYPLEIQNYDAPDVCLDRWVVAMANTGGQELVSAHQRITKNVFAKWKTDQRDMYDVYSTFSGTFKTWAFDESDKNEAVLYILSHRRDSPPRLVFADEDYFQPDDIRRASAKPSVAILNACGTYTDPGPEDFIGRLNRANVAAIIATKHQIPYQMAAQFTECLATAIDTKTPPQRSTFNLGYAFFDAIGCLRQQIAFLPSDVTKPLPKQPPWNARALAYSLIGNGGLMACPPGKKAIDAPNLR